MESLKTAAPLNISSVLPEDKRFAARGISKLLPDSDSKQMVDHPSLDSRKAALTPVNVWNPDLACGYGLNGIFNAPPMGCTPVYWNPEKKPDFVQVGNQKLMTLRSNGKSYPIPAVPYYRGNTVHKRNFDFIVEFLQELLKQNLKIETIVDVGSGGTIESLELQTYLEKSGLNISVCPVDVITPEHLADFAINLPVNLIPAQEIRGADAGTTLFMAMRPMTIFDRDVELFQKLYRGEEKYYLNSVLENNPNCFLMVSEDPGLSSPNRVIPAELVYTKRFSGHERMEPPGEEGMQRLSSIGLNSEKLLAEQRKTEAVNRVVSNLSADRSGYLNELKQIKNDKIAEMKMEMEQFFDVNFGPWMISPNALFSEYVLRHIESAEIKKEIEGDERESLLYGFSHFGDWNWHVYKSDAPVENPFSSIHHLLRIT